MSENLILLGRTFIRVPGREPHAGVVVYRVDGVGQHFLERAEVHGVAVAVKKQNVVGINLTNRLLNILVPDLEPNVFGIGWLVHGIVPCDLGLLINTRKYRAVLDRCTQLFPA